MKRLRVFGLRIVTAERRRWSLRCRTPSPALVFGIIDYGLWFSDSLSTRQGVREAARQGVVANFGEESAAS